MYEKPTPGKKSSGPKWAEFKTGEKLYRFPFVNGKLDIDFDGSGDLTHSSTGLKDNNGASATPVVENGTLTGFDFNGDGKTDASLLTGLHKSTFTSKLSELPNRSYPEGFTLKINCRPANQCGYLEYKLGANKRIGDTTPTLLSLGPTASIQLEGARDIIHYNIKYRYFDKSGNAETWRTIRYTIDPFKPDVSIVDMRAETGPDELIVSFVPNKDVVYTFKNQDSGQCNIDSEGHPKLARGYTIHDADVDISAFDSERFTLHMCALALNKKKASVSVNVDRRSLNKFNYPEIAFYTNYINPTGDYANVFDPAFSFSLRFGWGLDNLYARYFEQVARRIYWPTPDIEIKQFAFPGKSSGSATTITPSLGLNWNHRMYSLQSIATLRFSYGVSFSSLEDESFQTNTQASTISVETDWAYVLGRTRLHLNLGMLYIYNPENPLISWGPGLGVSYALY